MELGNPDALLFGNEETCDREEANGTAGIGCGKKRTTPRNGEYRYYVPFRKEADVLLVGIGRRVAYDGEEEKFNCG